MRLFVAIDLGARRDFFLELQRKIENTDADVRFARQFHLTLAFLGEFENPEEIVSKLKEIKPREIELCIQGIGFFPNKEKPRVGWVGLVEDKDVQTLAGEVSKCLGVVSDYRNFKGHITLFRTSDLKTADKINVIADELNRACLRVKINEFTLFRSMLTQMGPRYEVIERFEA